MDHFSIIQHFFSRLRCQSCHEHFDEDGIELVRENEGLYLVRVSCCHCGEEAGMAMVGVEQGTDRSDDHSHDAQTPLISGSKYQGFTDPELTPAEIRRLSQFDPVSNDDVIEAHRFFQGLGHDWRKHLPDEQEPAATGTLQ
ncbi:MAG: hypothetical protein KC475_02770 [Cyanobacteria bacterium HKST-UBA03]|nr:hypothetical protein [Cyanobacteria bacterium HKST-UBA03]